MVNLTVDLFGHSVNLFEIGGRVEGLEKILADNFGPKGYFGAKQDFTPYNVALYFSTSIHTLIEIGPFIVPRKLPLVKIKFFL
jgi:hypothetical protein